VLVSLLNAVVEPAPPVTGVRIVVPHTDKASAEEKTGIGDVKAVDQGNRQFHLEMQWQTPWFFPKRVLYYWGKFHPQQLREGEHDMTLRPTISICFTNQMLFPDVPDHHLVFRLREEKSGVVFNDDLEVHLLELPKFAKTVERLTTALDRWLYFLRFGADLDPDNLPATLDVLEIRKALEVLTMFSQDEVEREKYELRLMYQRDQASLVQNARETGELIGQVRLCQELLKQPPTPQAELSSLSVERLTVLLAHLRKQLLPNGS
jgi:predicted transposase/invertase (TIGR01784 family)